MVAPFRLALMRPRAFSSRTWSYTLGPIISWMSDWRTGWWYAMRASVRRYLGSISGAATLRAEGVYSLRTCMVQRLPALTTSSEVFRLR